MIGAQNQFFQVHIGNKFATFLIHFPIMGPRVQKPIWVLYPKYCIQANFYGLTGILSNSGFYLKTHPGYQSPSYHANPLLQPKDGVPVFQNSTEADEQELDALCRCCLGTVGRLLAKKLKGKRGKRRSEGLLKGN